MKKKLAMALCAAMVMSASVIPGGSVMAEEPMKVEFFQQKPEDGPQKGYQALVDKFKDRKSVV